MRSSTDKLPVVYEYDGYADESPVYDEASCPAYGYEFFRYESLWGGNRTVPHCGQWLDWGEEEA